MTTNSYYFEIETVCPVDGSRDFYRNCEIRVPSTRMIMCEEIASYVAKLKRKKIFQEDLTRRIAKRFKAFVQLECCHSSTMITVVSQWDGTPK